MATKFPPPQHEFIRARNQGGRQTPKAIVLHGTVSSDNRGTARNIANWWNGPTSPMSSAHYVVDPGTVIQCVGDHRVAYHSGYNQNSIGVEFCDEQAGPASRWGDKDSTAILKRAARLTAELCLAYGIKPFRPSVAELKQRGPHGIYGHNDSRLAFGNTTHTDPRDFPWEKFLRMVRAEIRSLRQAAKPTPRVKTFKILHAPLHGASATKAEVKAALNRKGVVGVSLTEAYRLDGFLRRQTAWRAVMGNKTKDARGRMVRRNDVLLTRRFRKHIDSGVVKVANESDPLKIAPERWLAWSIDNVHGRPLLHVTLHPHAAVRDRWDSDRAREFRRSLHALQTFIRTMRSEHGADLDIVISADMNYPNVPDGNRHFTPRNVFDRLDLDFVVDGIDWVAYSKGLRVVDSTVIPKGSNGQDHPWIEVELARV